MGETRPKESGEFELDDYLLELHRTRKGKSYTLLFRSPREGDSQVHYRMMHSHVAPDRYVFLETGADEKGRLTDQYQYSLSVLDAARGQGKLSVINRMGAGGTINNIIEWTRVQEQAGTDAPNPEQTAEFRRVYEDLVASHPIITY